jgi:pimeloyl-ACP methyl ester carboxylesterase
MGQAGSNLAAQASTDAGVVPEKGYSWASPATRMNLKQDTMHTPSVVRSKDGTPLAFWRQGSGAALLLVHGGLCDHLAWHFVAPLLARHFAVWTFDRRGRGESGETQPWSFAREVEDIHALLGKIGEPVHLLGHSAGAILALSAASRGDQLRSLILYEPPFLVAGIREHPTPELLAHIEQLLVSGDSDQALRIAMRETADLTDGEIDAMQSSPGWKHLRGAARAIPNDWRIWQEPLEPDSLKNLTVPTLVLAGTESPAWIRAGALAVLNALPEGTFAELAGQGHSGMITAPELFAKIVGRFAENVAVDC